jgi:hypothetical protein
VNRERWGSRSTSKVLASARAFKEKGLADHGWAFINIDDGWEIKGDAGRPKQIGAIVVNEVPDMKRLPTRSMGGTQARHLSPGRPPAGT